MPKADIAPQGYELSLTATMRMHEVVEHPNIPSGPARTEDTVFKSVTLHLVMLNLSAGQTLILWPPVQPLCYCPNRSSCPE